MKRFQAPRQGEQFPSEYDFPSDLLIDLNQRDIAPVYVVTINLANAGTMLIGQPGRAFVPYFWETGTTQKTRATAGFVTAYPNQSDASNPQFGLTCKHNRGYRGSFSRMYLTWTAQAGVSVDLVFLRSKCTPWMTDAPASTGSGGGSFTAATNAVSGSGGTYAGQSTDNFVVVDATSVNWTVTTPAPSNGQIFGVVKKDTSAHTVAVSGNVNGGTTVTLRNQNDAITFWSDGTSWYPFA